MQSFKYYVFYGGISISEIGWGDILNLKDHHFDQGFAWENDVVDFMISNASHGPIWVEIVDNVEASQLPPGTPLRIIEVPYRSDGHAQIVTPTIEPVEITIPKGSCQLRFDLHPPCQVNGEDYIYRIRFIFTPDDNPIYRIVKNDPSRGMPADRVLCKKVGYA